MRRISQSEASSWLLCRAQYRYGYDMNLEQVNQSDYLNWGNLGHAVLEEYYTALMEGDDHEAAIVRGRRVLMGAFDKYGMEDVTKVDQLLQGYWAFYDRPTQDWDILAVEETFDLEVTEEFTMPTKLDLLIRRKSDGKMGIVDHKFRGEFATAIGLALDGQLPKYISTLKVAGYPIEFGMINEIRTRKMKDPPPEKLFKRQIVTPSIAKSKAALRQQIVASKEITAYREQPVEVRKGLATPLLNSMVCSRCFFKELCASEVDGGDVEYLIANEYQQKVTYGYNDDHLKVQELM